MSKVDRDLVSATITEMSTALWQIKLRAGHVFALTLALIAFGVYLVVGIL